MAGIEPTPADHHHHGPSGTAAKLALTMLALGVVFGDIGTSPLYAIKESMSAHHGMPRDPSTVLGVLSLFFWSLTIVITTKYAWLVLQADNRGEGGIFSLLSLLPEQGKGMKSLPLPLFVMGLLGASLLYAEGVITPSLSVLSAVEGLEVISPDLTMFVIPATCVIMVALFSIQRFGTAVLGSWLGPVMLAWFTVMALLGIRGIMLEPSVLGAINPVHAIDLARHHPHECFVALGSVMLCITGGEALYADLGHFGRFPIRAAWYGLVMPSLLLNYFGQGAMYLQDMTIEQPFFRLAPSWGLIPLVIFATLATCIASQSILTGLFSLTHQAVQLGLMPRLRILQTGDHQGHIFVPLLNLVMMIVCLLLVLIFRRSMALADAYGLSVSMLMLMTTILFTVYKSRTGWGPIRCGLFLIVLGSVDLVFLGANLLKIPTGGWLTLTIAAGMLTLMWTWHRGRQVLSFRFNKQVLSFDALLNSIDAHPVPRVQGTAIFLTPSDDGVPPTLLHHLKHNKVLHQNVAIMSIRTAPVPRVPEDEQVQVTELRDGFFRVRCQHGYNQSVDVPRLTKLAAQLGLESREGSTTYYLGRTILTPRGNSELAGWQKRLFCTMSQVGANNPLHFSIPPGRMVELGIQIDL
ncbi:MAG: potassium transporter Kup [Phycisphaerae bacterium]|nr:potassium transporter Kup [Phycisphaerae bacterium]